MKTKTHAGGGGCLTSETRVLLSLCGVRLLCQDKHLTRLVQIYRQSLALSVFQTLGVSNKTVSSLLNSYSATLCPREVEQVCPKELLQ